MYSHHLLYSTNMKSIEILRGKFDSFPSIAIFTIDLIFTLDIIYFTYFDWIKYFIYGTNKCTLDTYIYSSVSRLCVSSSLFMYFIASLL